jgi:chromosome segregation ATPase
MIPPSMRDIDSTVDFVKDLLKNDNSARASPSIDLPGTFSAQRGGKQPAKDASVYKHDDSRATGYKSSARHLDRKQVRYEGEDKDEELGSIRRDLENSSKVLDRTAANFAERTEEDERLEQELDDLKYRVRRVKDDIEYVSRGKRSDDKDEERRKLERELLHLMHERLPEVEKKIEEREDRKRQEARDGIRARDKRNETYGRYRDRDYDRDRDYERRDRFDDDRYRRGSRDNSRERRGSRGEYDSYSSRRPISPPPRDRTPPATPAAPRDAVHQLLRRLPAFVPPSLPPRA